MFSVGDTLGDYRIVSQLSVGGMATLFLGRRAVDPHLHPPVAIKVIHEQLSEDWQFVRMFIDEALISVRIRHPNVVRVDELGEKDNVYYLVMEYVHGCSLAQLLRAMGQAGRRMRPEIAVHIAKQVATGLHAAHETTGDEGQLLNVIHRDVSPQNVLLSVDGRVKLLDFGIAKAAGRAERTEAGVIKGKVRYMAPEQARGKGLDRRVDIYALGVVLWEMLTMRRFIEGNNEVEIIRKVRNPNPAPPGLRVGGIETRIDDAVMAALIVDRDRRPPTALAFETLLRQAVPDDVVGPAHVAELLRVFMREELSKSAESLPADIAGPLVQMARSVTPLPGEDETTTARITDSTRSERLTMGVPRISFDEMSAGDGAEGDEPAPLKAEITQGATPSAMRRPRTDPSGVDVPPPPSALPPSALAPPPAELPPGQAAAAPAPREMPALPELPRYGAVGDEEERTVEASGHELAQFLQRIRADAAGNVEPDTDIDLSELEGGRPDSRTVPVQVSGFEATAPAPPPSTASKPTSTLGWVLRVLLITLVAFALGAGAAVAYVRFLR
ncbi:MAG: serine/threonine-protein kinase [Sandaracinaceae bacterium]